MTAMMRSLGMMLSMGAVLVVFAIIMGATAVTSCDISRIPAERAADLLAFAVLSAIGVFLSLYRNKKPGIFNNFKNKTLR